MNLTETQSEYLTVLTALEVYASLPETHPAVRATEEIATDGGVLALDQDELLDLHAIVHTGNAHLDHAEFNTVFAALRTYQAVAADGAPGLLTHAEIDDYCERINFAAGSTTEDLSVTGDPPPPRPSGAFVIDRDSGRPQSMGWAVMPLIDRPYRNTEFETEAAQATHEVVFHNGQLGISGRFPVPPQEPVSPSVILSRYHQDRYVLTDMNTPGMSVAVEAIRASDGPQQVFDLDTAIALHSAAHPLVQNP